MCVGFLYQSLDHLGPSLPPLPPPPHTHASLPSDASLNYVAVLDVCLGVAKAMVHLHRQVTATRDGRGGCCCKEKVHLHRQVTAMIADGWGAGGGGRMRLEMVAAAVVVPTPVPPLKRLGIPPLPC